MLGDLSIRCDWGWALEYVVAMHRMLQRDVLEDYVIATGITSSLEDFVAEIFGTVGLDWREHVEHVLTLMCPSEIQSGRADVSRAAMQLGWKARYVMPDVAKMITEARLACSTTPFSRTA